MMVSTPPNRENRGETKTTTPTTTVTPEEILQITKLRQLVATTADPDNHLQEDRDVLRFVRARPTLEKSAEMLRKHLQWRQETKPWQAHCPACDETPGYHALRQIGFDLQGRPIIYTCFVQCADGTGIRNGMEHLMYAIENAVVAMKEYDQRNQQIGDGKWVWMLDYAGFGYQNMSLSSSKDPLALLQQHYPERLHKVIMLNAPWIFGGFLTMLKPFIDAKTFAKAAFVRGAREEVQKGLYALGLGNDAKDDVVEWILNEMEQNRITPYPETQRQFWKLPASGEHDPRGSASFIKEYLNTYIADSSTGCCRWSSGLPAPDMVIEMTGCTIHEHYACWDKENPQWYMRKDSEQQSDVDKNEVAVVAQPTTTTTTTTAATATKRFTQHELGILEVPSDDPSAKIYSV